MAQPAVINSPPTPVVVDPAGPRTLPSGWKIEYDGYSIRGNVRSGIQATIPFIMDWANAGTFIGQLIPSSAGATGGTIVWQAPFSITYALGARTVPLYAQSFVCTPLGYRGVPATGSGLGFGDYFSDAKITVEFESTTMIQTGASVDDPAGKNQLDPSNPLTACEQSILSTGKVDTMPGGAWAYSSGSFSGKPVKGEVYLIRPEVRLMCKFPRIPFLPWQLIQPYVGKINLTAILNCVKGSLLLEAAPTIITPNMDGSLSQNLGLSFAFNPDPTGATVTGQDWNNQPFPDGSGYSLVVGVGDATKSPYQYAEFANIFSAINF